MNEMYAWLTSAIAREMACFVWAIARVALPKKPLLETA
jgi:hypothetical protein